RAPRPVRGQPAGPLVAFGNAQGFVHLPEKPPLVKLRGPGALAHALRECRSMDELRDREPSGHGRGIRVGLRLPLSITAVIGTFVVTAPAVSSTGVEDGAPAVWDVAQGDLPTEGDASFTALVFRLGCNNGETGVVLA